MARKRSSLKLAGTCRIRASSGSTGKRWRQSDILRSAMRGNGGGLRCDSIGRRRRCRLLAASPARRRRGHLANGTGASHQDQRRRPGGFALEPAVPGEGKSELHPSPALSHRRCVAGESASAPVHPQRGRRAQARRGQRRLRDVDRPEPHVQFAARPVGNPFLHGARNATARSPSTRSCTATPVRCNSASRPSRTTRSSARDSRPTPTIQRG